MAPCRILLSFYDLRNAITRLLIRKCLVSFVPLSNGVTTLKAHITSLKYGMIMLTFNGLCVAKISIAAKPDGPSIYLVFTSNGFTNPVLPWEKLMLCPAVRTMPMVLKMTMLVYLLFPLIVFFVLQKLPLPLTLTSSSLKSKTLSICLRNLMSLAYVKNMLSTLMMISFSMTNTIRSMSLMIMTYDWKLSAFIMILQLQDILDLRKRLISYNAAICGLACPHSLRNMSLAVNDVLDASHLISHPLVNFDP